MATHVQPYYYGERDGQHPLIDPSTTAPRMVSGEGGGRVVVEGSGALLMVWLVNGEKENFQSLIFIIYFYFYDDGIYICYYLWVRT